MSDDIDVRRRNAVLIPAQPGYYLLDLIRGSDEFAYLPVIAWRIVADSFGDDVLAHRAEPISIEAINPELSYIILDPSGCVTVPDEYQFDSEDAALKHMIAERKRGEEKAA